MARLLIPIPHIAPSRKRHFHEALMASVTRITTDYGVPQSYTVPVHKRATFFVARELGSHRIISLNTYGGQISTVPIWASTTASGSIAVCCDLDILIPEVFFLIPTSHSSARASQGPMQRFLEFYISLHSKNPHTPTRALECNNVPCLPARASSDFTRAQLSITSNHRRASLSVRRQPSDSLDLLLLLHTTTAMVRISGGYNSKMGN